MAKPFLLLLLVSFHVGPDSSLYLFCDKRATFCVCFLLYLLFKKNRENAPVVCALVQKIRSTGQTFGEKKATCLLFNNPDGLAHTMGLNLLQLQPCSQLLGQKPEGLAIVNYSLAVMC